MPRSVSILALSAKNVSRFRLNLKAFPKRIDLEVPEEERL